MDEFSNAEFMAHKNAPTLYIPKQRRRLQETQEITRKLYISRAISLYQIAAANARGLLGGNGNDFAG